MKENINKKKILFLFAIIFAVGFLDISHAKAEVELDWDNPVQSGKIEPYKFKITDVVDSKLLVDVVGCTGIVDKVSGAISNFEKKIGEKIQEAIEKKARKKIIELCKAGKTGAMSSAAAAFGLNLTDVVDVTLDCQEIQQTEDKGVTKAIKSSNDEAEASRRREECFNGIAFTLAKNQLTAMTKYAMNWIATGFNGDPMYVRDAQGFVQNLSEGIINTELNLFGDTTYYPYGTDFSRSYITMYKGKMNAEQALRSNMKNYLSLYNFDTTNKQTYQYSESDYIEEYSNNFLMGGWDGWLAFTQRDQNNPLGFTVATSQYIADKQNEKIQETEKELDRNQGVLSQKKCVAYGTGMNSSIENATKNQAITYLVQDKQKAETATQDANAVCLASGSNSTKCKDAQSTATKYINTYNSHFATAQSQYGVTSKDLTSGANAGLGECTEWEVVTPGILIKDKISAYLTSDTRQLELADTINEALNSVFSKLMYKLSSQGLTSLASNNTDFYNMNLGGSGSNASSSADANTILNNTTYASGYGDGVDLTKDLGNTYIHGAFTNMGSWDAKNNVPRLYEGQGTTNSYYTVSVAGSSEIITDGYNGWEVGDRAFFDGQNWQNWKKGQLNPIENRGIVQLQQDYLVAAKEALKTLPNVMPKIGELDYCIPGPNPNWQTNSSEEYNAFTNYVNSLNSSYTASKTFERSGVEIISADTSSTIYKNFKSLFNGTNFWQTVWESIPVKSIWFTDQLRDGGNFDETDEVDGGVWKGTSRANQAIGIISDVKNKIFNDLDIFETKYNTLIKNTYGEDSLMQKQYLSYEYTSTSIPNSAYLKMAKSGLNITKDIVYYDEDVSNMIQQYKDNIIETNSNITQLNNIKDKVSAIIKAAQARRDANKAKIKSDFAEKYGRNITDAEYAQCVAEEKVSFYEDTEIMGYDSLWDKERCDNDLDDDYDGLIDSDDPDCPNYNPTNSRATSSGRRN